MYQISKFWSGNKNHTNKIVTIYLKRCQFEMTPGRYSFSGCSFSFSHIETVIVYAWWVKMSRKYFQKSPSFYLKLKQMQTQSQMIKKYGKNKEKTSWNWRQENMGHFSCGNIFRGHLQFLCEFCILDPNSEPDYLWKDATLNFTTRSFLGCLLKGCTNLAILKRRKPIKQMIIISRVTFSNVIHFTYKTSIMQSSYAN